MSLGWRARRDVSVRAVGIQDGGNQSAATVLGGRLLYELNPSFQENAAARIEDDTPPDGAIDDGNLDAKRATLNPLGVAVRLAVENDEKVAYVSSPVLGAKVLSIIGKPSKMDVLIPTAHPYLRADG